MLNVGPVGGPADDEVDPTQVVIADDAGLPLPGDGGVVGGGGGGNGGLGGWHFGEYLVLAVSLLFFAAVIGFCVYACCRSLRTKLLLRETDERRRQRRRAEQEDHLADRFELLEMANADDR